LSHPHVNEQDRDAVEDLGLIEGDNTPDMRKPPAATRGLQKNDYPTTQMKGQS
jgi:hypothetical protein